MLMKTKEYTINIIVIVSIWIFFWCLYQITFMAYHYNHNEKLSRQNVCIEATLHLNKETVVILCGKPVRNPNVKA